MNKRILTGQILLNVGTVLTVALLLFAYHAWAAPVMEVAPAAVVAASAPTVITATTTLPDGATVSSVMPGAISYQGTLLEASEQPISGNVNMTFGLYDTPTGGTSLWTETHSGVNAVPVENGLFHVLLGSLTPIPATVWGHETLYLGVKVGNDLEMVPREIVGMNPLAFLVQKVPIGSISQVEAPTLVESVKLNTRIQYGAVAAIATEPTNQLRVHIDYPDPFAKQPFLLLQPSYQYTPYVIATYGLPCDHTGCEVFLRRLDGHNWGTDQVQGVDWVAIRE